jgi:hypothetical protein
MALWILVWYAPVFGQQQMPEGWDRYLGHPRGPYRGRIVDADTKVPLPGAVVVALWRRDRVYPFQVNSENYAVRETVTDSEGRFVMEVRDIEEGAPRRTHKPEFLVFLPGYGAFPHRQTTPRGFTAEVFYGAGTTVALPRLAKREERLQNLDRFGPYDFSKSPQREVPRLIEAINEERLALGLNAYPSAETD